MALLQAGAVTDAGRIREMLRAGLSPAEIRAELGCSYQAIASARKGGGRPVGKPRKHPACTHCGGTGNEPADQDALRVTRELAKQADLAAVRGRSG